MSMYDRKTAYRLTDNWPYSECVVTVIRLCHMVKPALFPQATLLIRYSCTHVDYIHAPIAFCPHVYAIRASRSLSLFAVRRTRERVHTF